jgi:hypothetical protein
VTLEVLAVSDRRRQGLGRSADPRIDAGVANSRIVLDMFHRGTPKMTDQAKENS